MIYTKRSVKGVREALPLSRQVGNGPLCFLNSFPERSLGAAGPEPGADRSGVCLSDMFSTLRSQFGDSQESSSH